MAEGRRFGVLGWPVRHSRSPAMHRAAYEALGLDDHRYQLLPVPPELFVETVRALQQAGFAGANVTIPNKERALLLAQRATKRAQEIGAANTLTFEPDGTISADNTDAPALTEAIGDPPPHTAVVLGAGGSARAAVWALRQAGTEVSVLARTRSRAEVLGVRLIDRLELADCLVNCTPVGLDNPEALPAEPDGFDLVVDLVYGPRGTALIRRARVLGARTVDGLEILVRQGALSFQQWTGEAAPLDAMRLGARGVH